ncbi:MAG: DUF5615 family PIN-like protein [Pseudonocardiaceae bacterium]
MKFLVDAQLPARLARFLSSSGHDALHTLELPDGNRTTDARIAEVADGSDRVVVTKDRDFRDSYRCALSQPCGGDLLCLTGQVGEIRSRSGLQVLG